MLPPLRCAFLLGVLARGCNRVAAGPLQLEQHDAVALGGHRHHPCGLVVRGPAVREAQREAERIEHPAGGLAVARAYRLGVRCVENAVAKEKREQALALFRKYGDRYDMDDLLLMAQGYQESELRQEARSPVGAIGVMQVMPATGRSMQVGDITEPIRTQRGYQLLKLESRTEAKLRSFEEARGDIGNRIGEQKLRGEREKYLDRLRSQATITWRNAELEKAYNAALAKRRQASSQQASLSQAETPR